MPHSGGDAIISFEVESRVSVAVYEVELWITFWMTRGWVDMQSSEMTAPLEIEIGASVEEVLLIAEDDKSASGDLEMKLMTGQGQWGKGI